jgi:hypothetical protein
MPRICDGHAVVPAFIQDGITGVAVFVLFAMDDLAVFVAPLTGAGLPAATTPGL